MIIFTVEHSISSVFSHNLQYYRQISKKHLDCGCHPIIKASHVLVIPRRLGGIPGPNRPQLSCGTSHNLFFI